MPRPAVHRWLTTENLFRVVFGGVLAGFFYAWVTRGDAGADAESQAAATWAPLAVVALASIGVVVVLYRILRSRSLPFRTPSRAEHLLRDLEVRTWAVEGQVQRVAASIPPPAVALAVPFDSVPLADRIRALDGYQFERLLRRVLEARGFGKVSKATRHSNAILDLVTERDDQRWLVQSSHWDANPVRPERIRELIGARTIEGADGCLLVSPHGFTEAAFELGNRVGVELVGMAPLVQWIDGLRLHRDWPRIQQALDARDRRCPRCESPLVARATRRGPGAGRTQWVCEAAPRCGFVVES